MPAKLKDNRKDPPALFERGQRGGGRDAIMPVVEGGGTMRNKVGLKGKKGSPLLKSNKGVSTGKTKTKKGGTPQKGSWLSGEEVIDGATGRH